MAPTTTTAAVPSTTTTIATTTTTIPATTHTVSITEFANTPGVLTIAAGDTVRWVNDGAMDHHVHSGIDPVEDGAWGSPDFPPGGSWSLTFTTPGMYDYFCSLHPLLMPGRVIVET